MSFHNVLRKIIIPNQQRVRSFCSVLTTTGKDSKQLAAAPDILMNKFKHAASTKNVLETVSDHEKVMNAKHIMQALRTLFILQKEGRSELSTREIINNKNFNKLCRRLKSNSGVIDINETIEALKVVTYVGVPRDSTIVQVLLQLIRHNVNDLSLSHIMFLEFLLNNYSNVPLAEALKIALPMVFEIQLPIKMDRNSIQSLREYLYYASRNKLSDKTVDLILRNMSSCNETSDVKTAKSILWSLTDLSSSHSFQLLLKKSFDTLLVHLDELSYDDIDITLSRMSSAYRKGCNIFSNKMFCDAAVGYIIDKNLGLKQSLHTMKKLDRLGVTNNYLIDYVVKKLEEENSFSKEEHIYELFILMKYLCRTSYRPKNWEFIEQEMENMIITKPSTINWLKVGAAWCHLKIFNESVLENSLNDGLEKIFQQRRSHIYLFMMIYHSLKLYKPQLLRLVPKNVRPRDLIQYLTIPDEMPLQGALCSAFGGEKYVKSGLYSKEGIFIDHAVVFRKGGYPVSTNFKSTFIEDLDISTDNQVALILCFMPELYTEEKRLKVWPEMCVKVLEDLGYFTVPICWSDWNSLADYEKIPYLVQNIKNKLGQDMISANSYAQ